MKISKKKKKKRIQSTETCVSYLLEGRRLSAGFGPVLFILFFEIFRQSRAHRLGVLDRIAVRPKLCTVRTNLSGANGRKTKYYGFRSVALCCDRKTKVHRQRDSIGLSLVLWGINTRSRCVGFRYNSKLFLDIKHSGVSCSWVVCLSRKLEMHSHD